MPSSVLSTPARRLSAAVPVVAAAALALAPNAQAGSPATAHGGTAGAVVLHTGLDVALLRGTAGVPLDVTLDDVHAPGNASETAVSARLGGLHGGRPFSVLDARAATARATADGDRSRGYANLVDARVALPGLRGPLLTVKSATSTATCEAGRHPVATSNVLGTVGVLGRPVNLSAGGFTDVKVPGVGRVRLALSQTSTTSRSAAATALRLTVDIDPGGLGVAAVKGGITLVQATCATPAGHPGGGSTGGTGSGGTSSGGSAAGGTGGGSAAGGTGGGSASGGTASGGSADGGSSGGSPGTGGSTSGSASGSGTSGGSGSGGSGSGGSGAGGATGGSSGSGGATGASGAGGSGASSGSSSSGGSSGAGVIGGHPQTVTTAGQNLAETGASSGMPLYAAGAAALLVVGGAVCYAGRRRRSLPED